MKFGKIKKQHSRTKGLDELLAEIVGSCTLVSRIIPGRITTRRGKTPRSFKVQYPTEAGLKCLYTSTGTVQEVFLITGDATGTAKWLREQGFTAD